MGRRRLETHHMSFSKKPHAAVREVTVEARSLYLAAVDFWTSTSLLLPPRRWECLASSSSSSAVFKDGYYGDKALVWGEVEERFSDLRVRLNLSFSAARTLI